MKNIFFPVLLFCTITVFAQNINSKIDFYKTRVRFPEMQKDTLLKHHEFGKAQKLVSALNKPNVSNKSNSFGFVPEQVILDDTLRISYSYFDEGKGLTIEYAILKSNVWQNWYRMTKYYFNNGYTDIKEDWINNEWEKVSKSQHTSIINGNTRVELSEQWSNNTLTYSHKDVIISTYKGNIGIIVYEAWTKNVLEYTYRNTNTYDIRGNIVLNTSEDLINGVWIPNSYRNTYTYDAKGKILTRMFELWENGIWNPSDREIHEYDNFGKELVFSAESFIGNQWIKQYRFTYTFDNNGNELTFCRESFRDTILVSAARENNFYDQNGNIIRYLSETYNNNNVWSNESLIQYDYDINGNAIQSHAYRWDNGWRNSLHYLQLYYNNKNDYLGFEGKKVDVKYKVFEGAKNIERFGLSQNYPNPFNPTTQINYQLPKSGFVSVKVYNIVGKEIATLVNGEKQAGIYTVNFNAVNLPSGVYIYTLKAGGFVETKKLLLLK